MNCHNSISKHGYLMLFMLVPFFAKSQVKPIDVSKYPNEIRIACVGNPVSSDKKANYPALLQQKLVDKFKVENFCVDDVTLLREGHNPYQNTDAFQKSLNFNPDVVIINLGLYDAGQGDWQIYRDEFTRDYLDLINNFKSLKSNPTVWICKMTPIFSQYPGFKSRVRDSFWEIQDAIELVAKVSGSGLIDLHAPLYSRPDLFQDFIHIDKDGLEIISQTIYENLTGDFGGLSMPGIFGSHMVLQRNRAIPIWGKANYDQKVEVVFDEEKMVAKTDIHGNWKVIFPPKEAGGPYDLKIKTDQQFMDFKDILIGEVWLCSGQSNMDFKASLSFNAESELANANHPKIRLMSMKSVDKTITTQWDTVLLNDINEHKFRYEPWQSCSPELAGEFSAVGYYFGLKLYNELNVPIGLIDNSKGGSPTETWIDRKTMEFDPIFVDMLHDWTNNDMIQKWCRDRAIFNNSNSENPLQRHPYEPAYLYETLIDPLVDFPIKGAIWYQGESNAQNVELHERLFLHLVKSWRKAWGEDFPFYYVQLSSFLNTVWPRFRDSQRCLMEKIPFSGMAVSSDVGDSLDIHPYRKKQVGERLALWALAKNYDRNVEFCGPLFTSVKFINNKAIVEFAHNKGLKSSDDNAVRTFEIAGEDKVYRSGNATIVDDKIEVFSEEVKEPKYVRYGWQPFTHANLINEAGLPASTFSSEY